MDIISEFGPAEFAAIIVLCTGGLIIVASPWINALRPSTRLRALEPDILCALHLSELLAPIRADAETYVEYETLRYKLLRLDIRMPPLHHAWADILVELLVCARLGQIREARCLFRTRR